MEKPKYLSADEQMKWYAHAIEYYSAIKACYNMDLRGVLMLGGKEPS